LADTENSVFGGKLYNAYLKYESIYSKSVAKISKLLLPWQQGLV